MTVGTHRWCEGTSYPNNSTWCSVNRLIYLAISEYLRQFETKFLEITCKRKLTPVSTRGYIDTWYIFQCQHWSRNRAFVPSDHSTFCWPHWSQKCFENAANNVLNWPLAVRNFVWWNTVTYWKVAQMAPGNPTSCCPVVDRDMRPGGTLGTKCGTHREQKQRVFRVLTNNSLLYEISNKHIHTSAPSLTAHWKTPASCITYTRATPISPASLLGTRTICRYVKM